MAGAGSVPDRLQLRGLRAVGTHGVLPEERERAQPFEADVELELDLGLAGRSDALGDTVDYGAVASAVVAVIAGEHSDLLEHLAERVAAAALECAAQADAVTVSIRKTRPPVPVELASAGVTIRRQRPRRPTPAPARRPEPAPARRPERPAGRS